MRYLALISLFWVSAASAAELPQLPVPVTNNAVAAVPTEAGTQLYTFNGLLEGKTWRDTTARAWTLPPGADAWVELPPVPEGEGRLASVASSVAGRAYVFGGYTVAEDGDEASLPFVHSIAPGESVYTRHADMPVPVDDAVAIPYMDRYIYLVSGWHDLGNVNLVQLYDTQTDSWVQARPWPGPPVFGHAGGIVGNSMVICDGVMVLPADAESPRQFVMSDFCARGEIDTEDPRRISWTQIAPHPGAPRYRMASSGAGDTVSFSGGSVTAYNYDGMGYDGTPAEPSHGLENYSVEQDRWFFGHCNCGPAHMDHRSLINFNVYSIGQFGVVIGGMRAGRVVTDAVVPACDPPGR
jgi:hypothetical protein